MNTFSIANLFSFDFFACRTKYRTLQELVEHYSKDSDGLCVNLRKACVQVIEFFIQTICEVLIIGFALILITFVHKKKKKKNTKLLLRSLTLV